MDIEDATEPRLFGKGFVVAVWLCSLVGTVILGETLATPGFICKSSVSTIELVTAMLDGEEDDHEVSFEQLVHISSSPYSSSKLLSLPSLSSLSLLCSYLNPSFWIHSLSLSSFLLSHLSSLLSTTTLLTPLAPLSAVSEIVFLIKDFRLMLLIIARACELFFGFADFSSIPLKSFSNLSRHC